jgi:3-oxoacyl-[acyl-carrier protein] reductase
MASRLAVVSGGTRGLGRAIVVELGLRGYQVIALYHRDMEAAASLEKELRSRNVEGACVRVDLGRDDTMALPVAGEHEEVVFVHNAAEAFEPRPLHLVSLAELEAQWAVAARGFLLALKALLRPMMRANVATVIAVTSRAVEEMPKGFAPYVAAKSALASLVKSVAVEYGARGIRTFVVRPGFMRTSLTEAWDAKLRAVAAATGEHLPEQVARAIVALLEDRDLHARGEAYDV